MKDLEKAIPLHDRGDETIMKNIVSAPVKLHSCEVIDSHDNNYSKERFNVFHSHIRPLILLF